MNENVVTRKEKFYDFCKSKSNKWLFFGVGIAVIITMIFSLIFNSSILAELAFVVYILHYLFESVSIAILRYNKETYMKNNLFYIILANFSSVNWLLYFFCYAIYCAITNVVRFDTISKLLLLFIVVVACVLIAYKISKHFERHIKKD